MKTKKPLNNFLKEKVESSGVDPNSNFGKFFYKNAKVLNDMGVDNSFKLDLIKKVDVFDKKNIDKKAFSFFIPTNKKEDDSVFNIKEWKNIYYKIRSSASNRHQAFNLAEKYSNDYSDIEKECFLRWFKFYANGEHKKYSGVKMKIKKKALHIGGIVPNSSQSKYDYVGSSFGEEDRSPQVSRVKRKRGNVHSAIDTVSDSYEAEEELPKRPDTSEELIQLKKSVSRGAKGIMDKLLKIPGISSESLEVFLSHMNGLILESNKLKSASAITSVTYKTANKIRKSGFEYGANELEKFAQELDQSQQPTQTQAQEQTSDSAQTQDTQQPVGQAEAEGSQEQSEAPSPKDGIPRSDEVEPAKFEDIETEGPQEGEYDGLIEDNIDINDASKKLDQVASMLADRRVIRLLAEFDIMLDKLAIASMFPELAESQSKLIDAFSYALTRVTKMMGQLSNAQTLMSESRGIPGSSGEEDGSDT